MSTATTPRPDRIVVVDDDARIRDLLRRYLTQEGFEVLLAEDGKALNRLLTRETVHLIVLDLMLPGEDGLSICRRLRAANDLTPIIMLTAKVEDVDRIVGLEVGADDYLPKPFNPRELVARIRAVLRRYEAHPAALPTRLEVNGVTLDTGAREAVSNGKKVELTTFEFDVLELLMRSAGRVLSRDRLMENFYNRKATPFDRSIDMHVSHLRRKLDGDTPLIKTIRGVGYQFVNAPAGAAGAS